MIINLRYSELLTLFWFMPLCYITVNTKEVLRPNTTLYLHPLLHVPALPQHWMTNIKVLCLTVMFHSYSPGLLNSNLQHCPSFSVPGILLIQWSNNGQLQTVLWEIRLFFPFARWRIGRTYLCFSCQIKKL